jgi:hypothetical protein
VKETREGALAWAELCDHATSEQIAGEMPTAEQGVDLRDAVKFLELKLSYSGQGIRWLMTLRTNRVILSQGHCSGGFSSGTLVLGIVPYYRKESSYFVCIG